MAKADTVISGQAVAHSNFMIKSAPIMLFVFNLIERQPDKSEFPDDPATYD